MTVVSLLLPRFSLLTALGERREMLGRPLALAPETGAEQRIGEISGAAEAHGVRQGMRLGEALSRCPGLVLVPPDPDRATRRWEDVLSRLEGIGAMVESSRAGEAYFEADGLRGICGGHLEGVLLRARRAVGMPARLGAAPNRFCAYAAALRGGRRTRIITEDSARIFLASLPVALLGSAAAGIAGGDEMAVTLERLGVRSLGELDALGEAAVADRFGAPGLRGLRLARGDDERLRPREPHQVIRERLELPEAASGPQLERVLDLLVDRLLSAPGLRGRTLRGLWLTARLAGGGGWRGRVTLRSASASAERLRLALLPRLAELPGSVEELGLEAAGFGPAAAEQLSMAGRQERRRRRRLAEAVRQVRAAAGRDAVLRVLEIDVDSRVPERRVVLTPFQP